MIYAALLNIPGKVNGATLANNYLLKSLKVLVNDLEVQNLSIEGTTIFSHFLHYVEILKFLKASRGKTLIYTPSCTKLSIIRDLFLLNIYKGDIILYYHNRGYDIMPNFWQNMAKRILSKSHRIILLDSPLLRHFFGSEFSFKTEYLPNTIECPKPKVDSIKISRSSTRLLYVGNLIESKGILDFIEVCSYLKKGGYSFEFSIIGQSADFSLDKIESIIDQKGLRSYMTHIGPLYGEIKMRRIKECDILLFPSRYMFESFPLVILEAMCQELLVIAYRIGAVEKMLGNAMLLANDVHDMSCIVERYISDSDNRLKMAHDLRQRYNNLYSGELYHTRLKEILNRL